MKSILRSLAVTTVAAAVLAACSSSSSSSAPTSGATIPPASATTSGTAGTTDAEAYLDGLCTSINTWQDDIQQGNQNFQSQVGSASSPQDVKDALSAFLDQVATDTDTMVSDIESLGAPDVADGDTTASTILSALKSVQSAFQATAASVDGLDVTNPQAMADALQQLTSDLQSGNQDIGTAFGSLENSELAAAAQNVPSCQSLANS